jgi:hypothetical protein
MKTKTNILTIIILFVFLNAFGQTDEKVKMYLSYDGLISNMSICYNCNLDSIVKSIRDRVANYPVDLKTEFRKEKGDTLIEIVSFNKNGLPDYSYYYNNLLKIRYSQTDSNNFMLIVMNDFEMEKKQWIVHTNEVHVTDYDEDSRMSHYYAEIYPDNTTKIELEKEWRNNKFINGQSITYKRENNEWKIQKTEKVGQDDWPKSTEPSVKIEEIAGFTELQKINLAHHIGSFDEKQHIVENYDSTFSFLPYRLKDNLEAGTYKIYQKFEKDFMKSKLLIDANILNGKLHGVYNEYDIDNGKIRIYCVYNKGHLNGRKTIYFYDKKGNFNYKITELWDNGKYVDRVP